MYYEVSEPSAKNFSNPLLDFAVYVQCMTSSALFVHCILSQSTLYHVCTYLSGQKIKLEGHSCSQKVRGRAEIKLETMTT